jgi:hypothetical protein
MIHVTNNISELVLNIDAGNIGYQDYPEIERYAQSVAMFVFDCSNPDRVRGSVDWFSKKRVGKSVVLNARAEARDGNGKKAAAWKNFQLAFQYA